MWAHACFNIVFSTRLQASIIVPSLQTTCEGVTISEVSGRDLCLLWSQATALDWVFEITTAVRSLHPWLRLCMYLYYNYNYVHIMSIHCRDKMQITAFC